MALDDPETLRASRSSRYQAVVLALEPGSNAYMAEVLQRN
jgi:hypothetical protein